MRKQFVNMRSLISANKKEILANEQELARIERQIDEKHMKKLQARLGREKKSFVIE